MLRKNLFTYFIIAVVILSFGITVFAQTGKSIAGKVEVKKEDGTTSPATDVVVELIRIDSKGKVPEMKTDAEGKFTFSDLADNGVYTLIASGAGLSPEIILNIKPGSDAFVFPISEGSGGRYTEEQARLASFASLKEEGKLSAEQKKMLDEYESKKVNTEQATAITKKALKEGNDAFSSKNYKLEIAKFDEGFNASPEYVGSAPVFLNNKAQALKQRAVDTYNDAVKSGDSARITEGKKQAAKDLSEALDSYNKSYLMQTQAPASEISNAENHKKSIYSAVDGGRDTVRIMSVIKLIDSAKADVAKTLVKAYLDSESDKTKKGQAQAALASYVMDSGDYTSAVDEYRKAIVLSPDDADTLAGISLALYTLGEDKKSKDMKQESLNYMDKFLRIAPKDHKLRDDIEGLANYIKTQEKLKPQKIN